jgi:ATP phosphoribosyltransferase regulatory subunit
VKKVINLTGNPDAQSARRGQQDTVAAARWPLPQGVVDLVYQDAATKRHLEHSLRQLFEQWGYAEVIPPSFEYADTLASEAGTQLAEEMYRFVDRDGRTLALRPDLTIPTARVVGTRLYQQPLPMRLSYIGSVFRYEPPQAGRQREFTQAGIELIGAATPAADAEVLALTVEALKASQVEGYRIALGQMAFFRALLAEFDLPQPLAISLQQAIDRKNPAELEVVLGQGAVTDSLRSVLRVLPGLQGGAEVLSQARPYCLNEAMGDALDRLSAINDLLAAYGLGEIVAYDLGETRGMEYYTGITFKGYVPGLGFSVCSGGRYDDLIGHFGPALPAVGCALWLDRLLLARQRQGHQVVTSGPDLLLGTGGPPAIGLAMALRAQGIRVELDVLERSPDELLDYARRRGIRVVAVCLNEEEVKLVDESGTRVMTVEDLPGVVHAL